MRIPPIVKAMLILIVILAVWIGIGIYIYNQINPSAQTPATTSQTTTTTTTTTTPTTTPTTNFSQDEQDYIAKITDHSSRVIAAITPLSELLVNPQIDNTTWVTQVTAKTNALKSLFDEISQVSTPYSMFEIHYYYTSAISLYRSAADTIEKGITEQNTSYIQQAISLINSGTSIITSSIDMLNDFIAARS